MTFEANLGLGWIRGEFDGRSATSDLALGGLSLGLGGWVSPKVAITGRIAGVTYSEDGTNYSDVFFGPSLQYWVDDHFWLGGGVGLGILAVSGDGADPSADNNETGLGFDLRVGYTFTTGSENTINASFELNPGHFSEGGQSYTFTGIGILLGYQHL